MRLLITRPEPDASAWRDHFNKLGIATLVDPLLEIEWLAPAALDLDGVQSLIATSRNGLRGLAASPTSLAAAARHPVFAVGPGTAALARELGFTLVHTGPAAGRDLVAVIARLADPTAGALLHLSGDKLAFDLAAALGAHAFDVRRLVVYHSRPSAAFKAATIEALRAGQIDTVMLMSPLSAKTFLHCAGQARLTEQCQRLVYLGLSQSIAGTVAASGCAAIHVAPQPNSQSLFTLIEGLAAGSP